jgi:hypothetical protein
MLAGPCFRKKCIEGIIPSTYSLIGRHLAIRLNAMLEAEELPAGVTNLNSSLTDVNRYDFSHKTTDSLIILIKL